MPSSSISSTMPCRAGIAELQPPLQHGDGRLLRIEDHVHRLRQQLIAAAERHYRSSAAECAVLVFCLRRVLSGGGAFRSGVRISSSYSGVVPCLDEVDDLLGLLVGDESSPARECGLPTPSGRIEHIAACRRAFPRPRLSRMMRDSIAEATRRTRCGSGCWPS